ncbi:MAG: 50S ribosomal protein L3 [Candidatus Roizmanbacteria bacterium]|nr:MAG: 50S ribosomal protein L3 [Candidatus Roizmanbacteria bacterium]
MSGFSLGKKSHQSQIFTQEGMRIPTTFIKTRPCYLVNIQWHQPNYFAVTLGFGLTKNIKKSIKGQLEKAGIKTPLRFLKEIRIDPEKNETSLIEEEGKKGLALDDKKIFIGDEIKTSLLFKKDDKVTVSGTSKGKGFQGVVKRHGFAGGPKTHGQSDRHRAPGSIGQTTTPGRVYKGKRMAGRMGGERVTVANLIVIEANDEGLIIKGLVPGGVNGLLEIRGSI